MNDKVKVKCKYQRVYNYNSNYNYELKCKKPNDIKFNCFSIPCSGAVTVDWVKFLINYEHLVEFK